MSNLLFLPRGLDPFLGVALGGLLLQVVALVLALRARNSQRGGRPSPLPELLAVAAPLVLLAVGYVMVRGRWEASLGAAAGSNIAQRYQQLAGGEESLGMLEIFHLGLELLVLQALLGAVVLGLSLSQRGRARAREQGDERGGPGRGVAVGVAVGVVLLTVLPFSASLMPYLGSWRQAITALSGVDPGHSCEMLLVAGQEIRPASPVLAAGGLLLACLVVAVIAVRRRSALPSTGRRRWLVPGIAAVCLVLSGGLYLGARAYREGPADGMIRRYLAARGCSVELARQLAAEPRLGRLLPQTIPPVEGLWLPRAEGPQRCKPGVKLTVTHRAILVEGKPVVALKDPAVKQRGGGHLIRPVAAALRTQVTRLKKLDQQRGWTTFDGTLDLLADSRAPYRLVADVLHSAKQAGFSRFHVFTLASEQPFRRRQVVRCVEVRPNCASFDPEPAAAKAQRELKLMIATIQPGFMVAGAGAVMRNADGGLPTLPCKAALENGRCPVRVEPGTQRWTEGYDYAALARLVGPLKRKFPRAHCAIVAAGATIPFQAVIHTLETVRGDCGGVLGQCLFDQPVLAPPVE